MLEGEGEPGVCAVAGTTSGLDRKQAPAPLTTSLDIVA